MIPATETTPSDSLSPSIDDTPRAVHCYYSQSDIEAAIKTCGEPAVSRALMYVHTYMLDSCKKVNVMLVDGDKPVPEIQAAYFRPDGQVGFFMVGIWDGDGERFTFHS